ncbi:MAG: elongation factor P [Planctomycetota bacterium]|nr:MAG: elongation factor P [Planctomycetota bacterium]
MIANEIKPNDVLLMDGELYRITSVTHIKPGKGGAFVKGKKKNLKTGAVTDYSFRSAEKVEKPFLEKKGMEFSYREGDFLYFMDTETYEQTPITKESLGDMALFLVEGVEVNALYHGTEIITIDLPETVVLEIKETEPGFKGDTAQGGNKPITFETGLTSNGPMFLNIGDKVKIDTRTGEYLERA